MLCITFKVISVERNYHHVWLRSLKKMFWQIFKWRRRFCSVIFYMFLWIFVYCFFFFFFICLFVFALCFFAFLFACFFFLNQIVKIRQKTTSGPITRICKGSLYNADHTSWSPRFEMLINAIHFILLPSNCEKQ